MKVLYVEMFVCYMFHVPVCSEESVFCIFLCFIFCIPVVEVYMFHVCGVLVLIFCLVYVQWPSVSGRH